MDPLRRACLLLNACKNVDSSILECLVELGLNLTEFLGGGISLWRECGMAPADCRLLSDLLDSEWAEKELDRCERLGVRLLTLEGRGSFPPRLRGVPRVPLALYVRGGGSLDDGGDPVAMVGTRRCSAYGARCARSLARSLGCQGCTVISGGALGIDGASHGGAMEGGSQTWAVLGTGVDRIYPGDHEELFGHIMEEGLLISQFPLGTEPRPWRFPLRNRVVAALAERLVVVEAPLRSGALITARQALEMGREVWAVPGRIGEKVCEGSNRLLFDGAFPLVDPQEFVDLYGGGSLFSEAPSADTAGLGYSTEEAQVLRILRSGGDRTIDNLAVEGKMAAADVNRILMLLTARGAVFPSGPGRWSASPET